MARIPAAETTNNFIATSAPGVNDDVSLGYDIGSRWVDVTNDKAYVCLDNTDGAAVWTEVTAGAAGGIANVVEDTTPQLGGNLDANGNNIEGVSPTEMSYLVGITSSVQTQLNAKGTGDVSKVGTPVNNQVGVWTGNGTIEGDANFTWYGYGDIEWSFLIKDHTTNINEKIPVHRVRLEGAVSIIDPNQPLSFRTGNGASGTTNTSLYIGGHQFSVLDAFSQKPMRAFSELLTLYTTATNTNWQPLIAFRKKTNFNGRTNSVLVRLKEFEVAADSDMEVRVTVGGTTSNLTWGAPTSVTATETAVETKVTGGTALTTSADGQPVDYTFVNAGGIGTNRGSTAVDEAEVVLGAGQEIILWIKRQSATGAMIIKHAHVTWEEEW